MEDCQRTTALEARASTLRSPGRHLQQLLANVRLRDVTRHTCHSGLRVHTLQSGLERKQLSLLNAFLRADGSVTTPNYGAPPRRYKMSVSQLTSRSSALLPHTSGHGSLRWEFASSLQTTHAKSSSLLLCVSIIFSIRTSLQLLEVLDAGRHGILHMSQPLGQA
eukprot:368158-Amphidinium_carterae.1